VKFLDQEVYETLLKDLSSIDYCESLNFAMFCEPFSQKSFLDRVAEARNYLPNALLVVNTNTDYLTDEVLKRAANRGLNLIKAQLYFDEDEEYCLEAVREKFGKLQKKIPEVQFRAIEGIHDRWFALVGDSMVIVAYAKDFRKVGHNRCDIKLRTKAGKRYHTCGEPIQFVGLNHNCDVTQCCNHRADYEPHKPFLIGTLDATPGKIFELYKGVFIPEDTYPCSTCMGKEWHACHKIVYEEMLGEMRRWQRQEHNSLRQPV
jgi:hypothetical protein